MLEAEETQKIYDELPFNDEIFNLSERNLEMYDKLGKVLTGLATPERKRKRCRSIGF